MTDLERRWKVGELARATGLTIRALHHYDEIGLLVPAARTEAGHRLYSAADVERLYRILALRGVGMALDEIAAVLDDDGVSLVDTVRRHVAAVERDIAQRRRLLDRLNAMLETLERSSSPTVDELIGAVEAMSVVEATIEDVVTREPWDDAGEMTGLCVVLLREAGGGRLLPIWIGEPEGAALVVQRAGTRLPRPMGPDLTVALLGAVEARVERVVVERLRAPILVAAELMRTAGSDQWPTGGESDPAAPPWMPLTPAQRPSRIPPHTVGDDAPGFLRRAADEARRLGHGWVGSAHLLLGILADRDDAAARLLARLGVERGAAREVVAAMFAEGRMPPPEQAIFLTPHATLTVRRALGVARSRGREEPAPSDVLLTLVDTPLVDASGAVAILEAAEVDVAALRTELAD